jgi:hypothetical protein
MCGNDQEEAPLRAARLRWQIIDSAEIEHIHGGMLDLKHIERISCVGHVR